jgi:hypothetical protein
MNPLLIAAVIAAAAAAAQAPVSFERVPALPGWWSTVRGDASKTSFTRDDKVQLGGQPTARIALTDPSGGWIDIGQSVDALQYRGKRVRFSAEARTEDVSGWSGLSIRVDGPKGAKHSENTQQHALKGTVGWTPLEIVFDVPEDSRQIVFSLGQDGAGTTWFGRVHLDVVDRNVPLSKLSHPGLANGGFEEGTEGWFVSGGGRKDYVQTVVTDVRRSGRSALKLTVAPEGDKKKYGTSMQFFDAAAFVGKRVRASVWVKTEGVTGRGDFWVRVQAPDSPGDGPGLGGGYAQVESDSDWTEYQTVFDVAASGTQIDFGVGLAGPGTVWIDDATFTVVPNDTPLRYGASLTPRNLSFTGR